MVNHQVSVYQRRIYEWNGISINFLLPIMEMRISSRHEWSLVEILIRERKPWIISNSISVAQGINWSFSPHGVFITEKIPKYWWFSISSWSWYYFHLTVPIYYLNLSYYVREGVFVEIRNQVKSPIIFKFREYTAIFDREY